MVDNPSDKSREEQNVKPPTIESLQSDIRIEEKMLSRSQDLLTNLQALVLHEKNEKSLDLIERIEYQSPTTQAVDKQQSIVDASQSKLDSLKEQLSNLQKPPEPEVAKAPAKLPPLKDASAVAAQRGKEALAKMRADTSNSPEQERRDTIIARQFAAQEVAIKAREMVNNPVPRGALEQIRAARNTNQDKVATAEARRLAAGTAAIEAREHVDGKVSHKTMQRVQEARASGPDAAKATAEGLAHAKAEAGIRARDHINDTVSQGTVAASKGQSQSESKLTEHPAGEEKQSLEAMSEANASASSSSSRRGLVDAIRDLSKQAQAFEDTSSSNAASVDPKVGEQVDVSTERDRGPKAR